VIFPTRGIRGSCEEGATVLEAVRRLGYVLDHACGGNARCGTCCVEVVEGADRLSPADPDEVRLLGELGYGPPHRLSCQARIHGDVIVLPAA
jgi:ferredoxin